MLGKCHQFNYSIEETEDGFNIHITGDKEKIKAKLEAMEAYHNYRQKAKAAGIGFHGLSNKFFDRVHNHLKEIHKHHGSHANQGSNNSRIEEQD